MFSRASPRSEIPDMRIFGRRRKSGQEKAQLLPAFTRPRDPRRDSAQAELEAVGRSQAIVRLSPEGVILDVNATFQKAMGYKAEEVVGEHHRIFVTADYAKSADYSAFWAALAHGEFQSGEFRRVAKDGSTVWLQGSYNPVFDSSGKVVEVLKIASDITARKQREATILNRTTAVIEFRPDGTISNANELFLSAMGYRMDEIRGKHHRMFVPPEQATSDSYTEFWHSLGQGEYHQGEFVRTKKDGTRIWLRGSYSPTLDNSGRVISVVKHATDITNEVMLREEGARTSDALNQALSELSSSVNVITGRLVRNSELAAQTRNRVAEATELLQRLNAASTSIETVTDVIRDIADRTNLLALNATIEAARAGEAGRGFSVVADEVKSLAGQSRSATLQISQQLATVVAQVSESATAVESISGDVDVVAANTNEVAAAVEEQSSVIEELSATAHTLASRSRR